MEKKNILILIIISIIFLVFYQKRFFIKTNKSTLKKYPYKRKNAMTSEQIEKILNEIKNDY